MAANNIKRILKRNTMLPGMIAANTALNIGQAIAGNKKSRRGIPEQQYSGFNAAPPGTKQGISETMKPVLTHAIQPQAHNLLIKYGLKPGTPEYNSALAKLQEMNPEVPLYNQGALADLHPAQIAALEEQANPDYSPEGLAQYLQPFQGGGELAKQAINKGFDTAGAKISENRALTGSVTNPGTSSRFQNLLRRNEVERGQALSGLEDFLQRRNMTDALALRNQSLQQQYGAGQAYQNRHQLELGAGQGYGQFTTNPWVGQAQGMLELMAPLLGGTQHNGAVAPTQSMFSRLLGAGQGALNDFGRYYQSQNIQGTPWNANNPYGR